MSLQQALPIFSTAFGVMQGQKEAKTAKRTAAAQEEAASKTAAAAEADLNKRNARKPDIAAISDKNALGMAEGGRTLLTGSTGVPSGSLRVMQKSLLGQ